MIEVSKELTDRLSAEVFEAMRPVLAKAIEQAYQEGYIAGNELFEAARQRQAEMAYRGWVDSTKAFPFEVDKKWLHASREAAFRTNAEKGAGYIKLLETQEGAQFGGTVIHLQGHWDEDPETIIPFLRHRFQVLEELRQEAA